MGCGASRASSQHEQPDNLGSNHVQERIQTVAIVSSASPSSADAPAASSAEQIRFPSSSPHPDPIPLSEEEGSDGSLQIANEESVPVPDRISSSPVRVREGGMRHSLRLSLNPRRGLENGRQVRRARGPMSYSLNLGETGQNRPQPETVPRRGSLGTVPRRSSLGTVPATVQLKPPPPGASSRENDLRHSAPGSLTRRRGPENGRFARRVRGAFGRSLNINGIVDQQRIASGAALKASPPSIPGASCKKLDNFAIPSSGDFSFSGNGRGGFHVEDVYNLAIGRKVSGCSSRPRVYLGKTLKLLHFLLMPFSIRQLGEGGFGTVTEAFHAATPAEAIVDFEGYRDERREDGTVRPCPDWYRVAVKKMVPTRLDTCRGRIRIVTYDDAETYISEVRALIHLCKGGDDGATRNSQFSFEEDQTLEASNYDVRLPVVFLYEFFWTGVDVFMVTEILETDLAHWIRKQEVLTEIVVAQIARRISEALCFIHSRGIVHRDIKMQNIMFKHSSDVESIKLVDFGLAKLFADDSDRVSDFCGSP
jgi:Protein kinase domain